MAGREVGAVRDILPTPRRRSARCGENAVGDTSRMGSEGGAWEMGGAAVRSSDATITEISDVHCTLLNSTQVLIALKTS